MKTPPAPTSADQQLIDALRHAEAMEAERDALATQNVLLREAIAEISAKISGLQRRADRDRWCEEYQADVVHLLDGRWCVTFLDGFLNTHTHIETSRDAAIDKAMKETE